MIVPSLADLIADACVLGGACVLATAAILRVSRRDYQRAVNHSLRQSMLWGVVVLTSMSDGVQVLIDMTSGVPNLGMLVRLVLLPVANYRSLVLLDDLLGTETRQRRRRQAFTLAAVLVTGICWALGAPHQASLPTIPVAVPLDGANHWLYVLAWLFPLELIVQCGTIVRLSVPILLHLSATGYDRQTCVRSLLFALAQCCFVVIGLGLLLYPPGQATGHFEWIDLSTTITESLGLLGALLCVAAYSAPLWAVRLRLRWVERLLRTLLVLSCYRTVRRLALYLQMVVPPAHILLEHGGTALWQVRSSSQLDLLMQLCKTAINDARLTVLPYARRPDTAPTDVASSQSPEYVAQVLAQALVRYQQEMTPDGTAGRDTALGDALLFNDERFLADLWRAYTALPGSPYRDRIVVRHSAHTAPPFHTS